MSSVEATSTAATTTTELRIPIQEIRPTSLLSYTSDGRVITRSTPTQHGAVNSVTSSVWSSFCTYLLVCHPLAFLMTTKHIHRGIVSSMNKPMLLNHHPVIVVDTNNTDGTMTTMTTGFVVSDDMYYNFCRTFNRLIHAEDEIHTRRKKIASCQSSILVIVVVFIGMSFFLMIDIDVDTNNNNTITWYDTIWIFVRTVGGFVLLVLIAALISDCITKPILKSCTVQQNSIHCAAQIQCNEMTQRCCVGVQQSSLTSQPSPSSIQPPPPEVTFTMGSIVNRDHYGRFDCMDHIKVTLLQTTTTTTVEDPDQHDALTTTNATNTTTRNTTMEDGFVVVITTTTTTTNTI